MKYFILIIFILLNFTYSCRNEDGIYNGKIECKNDSHCSKGRICSRLGQCIPDKRCYSDSQCLDNEVCNLELGLCVSKERCETDHDCKNDLRCILGVCSGCQTNDDCTPPMFVVQVLV